MFESNSKIIFGNEKHLLEQMLEAVDVPLNLAVETIGDEIGAYRLLEKIGEGGFGYVWRAQQSRPVRREVALKLLKRGMDSDQVLARFNLERQVLASMAHPHIAALWDAGMTMDGRPFFVMELVHGLPITNHCVSHHLPLRERVILFKQVCSAVQHAHQKGIIHRDLKPSNLLVTEIDGIAVPKIIDFGIAKVTEEQWQPWATRIGHLMGTPQYMSPEQLAGSADVDTRSDIYALGVLFYEMLTGSLPYEEQTRQTATHDEMRRVIEKSNLTRPSVKLTETVRTPIAEQAQTALKSTIPADLDWIIMMALEKDRDRRYESAAAFATDVQRFLNDEPVVACPPSLAYIIGRWTRRNRAAFAAACVCLLSIIFGTGVALWQAHEAGLAQRRAEAESQRALQAVGFLTTMLDRVAEEVGHGRNPEALKLALEGSEEKIRQIQNDPTLQSDLFKRVGWLYKTMGDRNLALAMLKAHAKSVAELHGVNSQEAINADLACINLTMMHGARIQAPAMMANLLARIESQGLHGSAIWLSAQHYVIYMWIKLRKFEQARISAEEILKDPAIEQTAVVGQLSIKGACLQAFEEAHDFTRAETLLSQCMAVCRDDPTLDVQKTALEARQISILRAKRDYRQGIEILVGRVALLKRIPGEHHRKLISGLLQLAEFESAAKQHDAAILHSREAISIARAKAPSPEALKNDPKLATLRQDMMLALFSVSKCESKAGHAAIAVREAQEAYRVADEEGNNSNIAEAMLLLAQMQEAAKDLDAAYATYELRRKRSSNGGANYQRWHEDLNSMCEIRLKQDRAKEAMALAEELWRLEWQSLDARNDAGHIQDIAEIALRCHSALLKFDPSTPAPQDLAAWHKAQSGAK